LTFLPLVHIEVTRHEFSGETITVIDLL